MTVCALAISANAVSFIWGSTGKISFGATVMDTASMQATAYLVLLGTTGSATTWTDALVGNLTDGSISESDYVSTCLTRTTGAPANRGAYAASYYLALNQNYSYGVFMTYTDGDGKAWFNFSSDIFTVDPSLEDNAVGIEPSFSHLATTGTISGDFTVANSVGKGWVAVPEPSVGLLALAGIGMLIRRKRA